MWLLSLDYNALLITAKYKETLQPLLAYFSEYIQTHNQAEGTTISNTRHYEALENTKLCLQKVLVGIDSCISSDFITMDIRESLFHLGTITGQSSTDDLLESIFSKFCIGKVKFLHCIFIWYSIQYVYNVNYAYL